MAYRLTLASGQTITLNMPYSRALKIAKFRGRAAGDLSEISVPAVSGVSAVPGVNTPSPPSGAQGITPPSSPQQPDVTPSQDSYSQLQALTKKQCQHPSVKYVTVGYGIAKPGEKIYAVDKKTGEIFVTESGARLPATAGGTGYRFYATEEEAQRAARGVTPQILQGGSTGGVSPVDIGLSQPELQRIANMQGAGIVNRYEVVLRDGNTILVEALTKRLARVKAEDAGYPVSTVHKVKGWGAIVTVESAGFSQDRANEIREVIGNNQYLLNALNDAVRDNNVDAYNEAVNEYNETIADANWYSLYRSYKDASENDAFKDNWKWFQKTYTDKLSDKKYMDYLEGSEFQNKYASIIQPSTISNEDYSLIKPYITPEGFSSEAAYQAANMDNNPNLAVKVIRAANEFTLATLDDKSKAKIDSGEWTLLPYGQVIETKTLENMPPTYRNIVQNSGLVGYENYQEKVLESNKQEHWFKNTVDAIVAQSVGLGQDIKNFALLELSAGMGKVEEGGPKPLVDPFSPMAVNVGYLGFTPPSGSRIYTAEEATEINAARAEAQKYYKDIYDEAEMAAQEWMASRPYLQPVYAEGFVDSVKKNPSALKDPALWGETIAATLPYTVATGIIVSGAALAGPVGVAAASPLAFGITMSVEGNDIYKDAIASGASHDQALKLANIYGSISASIETLGDSIFVGALGVGGGAFASALGKNTGKNIIVGAAKKYGWKNLTVNMIKDFVNQGGQEFLQEVVHNAAIKTVDQNQDLLENTANAFVSGVIGTAPFVLFPAGGQAIRNLETKISDVREGKGSALTPANITPQMQFKILDKIFAPVSGFTVQTKAAEIEHFKTLKGGIRELIKAKGRKEYKAGKSITVGLIDKKTVIVDETTVSPYEYLATPIEGAEAIKQKVMKGESLTTEEQEIAQREQERFNKFNNLTPEQAATLSPKAFQKWEYGRSNVRNVKGTRELHKAMLLRGDTEGAAQLRRELKKEVSTYDPETGKIIVNKSLENLLKELETQAKKIKPITKGKYKAGKSVVDEVALAYAEMYAKVNEYAVTQLKLKQAYQAIADYKMAKSKSELRKLNEYKERAKELEAKLKELKQPMINAVQKFSDVFLKNSKGLEAEQKAEAKDMPKTIAMDIDNVTTQLFGERDAKEIATDIKELEGQIKVIEEEMAKGMTRGQLEGYARLIAILKGQVGDLVDELRQRYLAEGEKIKPETKKLAMEVMSLQARLIKAVNELSHYRAPMGEVIEADYRKGRLNPYGSNDKVVKSLVRGKRNIGTANSPFTQKQLEVLKKKGIEVVEKTHQFGNEIYGVTIAYNPKKISKSQVNHFADVWFSGFHGAKGDKLIMGTPQQEIEYHNKIGKLLEYTDNDIARSLRDSALNWKKYGFDKPPWTLEDIEKYAPEWYKAVTGEKLPSTPNPILDYKTFRMGELVAEANVVKMERDTFEAVQRTTEAIWGRESYSSILEQLNRTLSDIISSMESLKSKERATKAAFKIYDAIKKQDPKLLTEGIKMLQLEAGKIKDKPLQLQAAQQVKLLETLTAENFWAKYQAAKPATREEELFDYTKYVDKEALFRSSPEDFETEQKAAIYREAERIVARRLEELMRYVPSYMTRGSGISMSYTQEQIMDYLRQTYDKWYFEDMYGGQFEDLDDFLDIDKEAQRIWEEDKRQERLQRLQNEDIAKHEREKDFTKEQLDKTTSPKMKGYLNDHLKEVERELKEKKEQLKTATKTKLVIPEEKPIDTTKTQEERGVAVTKAGKEKEIGFIEKVKSREKAAKRIRIAKQQIMKEGERTDKREKQKESAFPGIRPKTAKERERERERIDNALDDYLRTMTLAQAMKLYEEEVGDQQGTFTDAVIQRAIQTGIYARVKAQTRVLTKTQTQTAIQAAVKTALETETKTATEEEIKTATELITEIVTKTKTKTRLKTAMTFERLTTEPIQGKQKRIRKGPALAVWKQGAYWVSIFPPFRTTGAKEDVVYSREKPPWGSVIAKGRHSPRVTLRSIGKVPELIEVPMGVVTARIRNGRKLTFSRRNGRRRGRVIEG